MRNKERPNEKYAINSLGSVNFNKLLKIEISIITFRWFALRQINFIFYFSETTKRASEKIHLKNFAFQRHLCIFAYSPNSTFIAYIWIYIQIQGMILLLLLNQKILLLFISSFGAHIICRIQPSNRLRFQLL